MGQNADPSSMRVLRILEILANHPDGLTLVEISRQLSIPKSTVLRLLDLMAHDGYVYADGMRGVYTIGLKTLELGMTALNNVELTPIVTRHLHDIVNVTKETSFFAVYNDGYVVYLQKVEGTQSIRTGAQLGSRKHVHCTALGKAILSTLLMEEVDKILDINGLVAVTQNTITDRRRFHEELVEVRRRGYAVDNEEAEPGLTCFAAPVFNNFGNVVGAISVAGPTARMTRNEAAFSQKVKEAADAISRALGYVPSARANLGIGRT